METFQTVWKFSRHSGKFPDKTENLQKIQKHSRKSGKYPDDPETFQKLQWFSRQVLDIINKCMFSAKTFQTRKNFPGSNAPALPMYFCLWSCVTYHESYVPCHMSHVTCYVSHVTFHISQVMCHLKIPSVPRSFPAIFTHFQPLLVIRSVGSLDIGKMSLGMYVCLYVPKCPISTQIT